MTLSNPKSEIHSRPGSMIGNPRGPNDEEGPVNDLGSPLSAKEEGAALRKVLEENAALRAQVAALKDSLKVAEVEIKKGLSSSSKYRAELVRFKKQKNLLWGISADTYAIDRYIILLNLYVFYKYFPVGDMELIAHNVALYSFIRSSDSLENWESQDSQPLNEADGERTLFLEESIVQIASFLKDKGSENKRSWQSYIKHIEKSVKNAVQYEAIPRIDMFLGGLFNEGFIEGMIINARRDLEDESNDEELRWSCIWNHLQSLGRAQQDVTGSGRQFESLDPAILEHDRDRTPREDVFRLMIVRLEKQVGDGAFTNVEHRLRSNRTSGKLCPMFSYDFRATLVLKGIATTKEVDMMTCFSKRHRVRKWERNSSAHSLAARNILDLLELIDQPHQDLPPWVRADADMWAVLRKHLYTLIGGGFFDDLDFMLHPELKDLCKLYNPGLIIGIEGNDDSHDDSGDVMHSRYEDDSSSETSDRVQVSYVPTPTSLERANKDGLGNLEALHYAHHYDRSPSHGKDVDDNE